MFGLTSCNLAEIDKSAYYNQIVVTAGDKNFTMKQLVNAFETSGYQYYQNGSSLEDSIKLSATTMVQRSLLIDEIKKIITLDENNWAEIRKNAFDSMTSSIETYEEEVIKEWGITDDYTAEEETSLRDAKTEYEPSVESSITTNDNGEIVYTLNRISTVKDFNETVPAHFDTANLNTKTLKEAYNRYVKYLQKVAKNEGRSTKESDVVLSEEERLFNIYEENMYISLFENYVKNDVFDVYTDEVVENFIEQYKIQYDKFNADPSAYDTAMASATSSYVYYHLESSKGYVYVNHILLKFSDDQTKLMGQTSSDSEKEAIAKSTIVTYEENGVTKTATINEVFNRVTKYVNSAKTIEQKAKRFEEMMYMFNDDTGNMNADFNYNVNLDTTVEDKMVTEFADASRELYNDYSVGDIYPELVETEYGYHIIMYTGSTVDKATGLTKNIASINNIDNLTFETLCKYTVNPASEKTLFQYFYDLLSIEDQLSTDYSVYTTNLIKAKEKTIDIVYNEYLYSNLWSE